VVGAKEHELTRLRFDPGLIEHCAQRNAGPARVAREALERAPITRALEARHELGALHLLERVERQREGSIHQAGDLQAEGVGVDFRVPVVLRREELIFGCERPVDLAHVELTAIGGRRGKRVG
jgi:hypothetical protein